MNTAYVVCSRLKSSRVPGKPLKKYSGYTQIELLIRRLLSTNIPVILAIPQNEIADYAFLLDLFPKGLKFYYGFEDDPMRRMYEAAKENSISNIIRVTHDKIFINTAVVPLMVDEFKSQKVDYMYSSDFIAGTGFELISFKALELAVKKFSRVEHISYAIKAITKNIYNYKLGYSYVDDIRLLVDYYEDTQLVDIIISSLGPNCTLNEVVSFLGRNDFLKKLNKLPLVSVYTCAYNADKWIMEAMQSVAKQTVFDRAEYILIDDYSKDRTLFQMAKFAFNNKNTKYFRNHSNIGLASSSNFALKQARGKYVIRLDADDFFTINHAIQNLIATMEAGEYDIVYPDCYAGLSMRMIQKGKQEHHCGGTLFRTSAINMVKFTDSLMHYDSLDIFLRASDLLKIGYYNKPVFCYRQHNKSMSKNNLEERKKIKKVLLNKYASK